MTSLAVRLKREPEVLLAELAKRVPKDDPEWVLNTRNDLIDIDARVRRLDAETLLEVRRAARVTEWHMARRWPPNPVGHDRADDRPNIAAASFANSTAWQAIYTVGRANLADLLAADRPDALTQKAVIRAVRLAEDRSAGRHRHPAPYNDPVLEAMTDILDAVGAERVLDPFAGTGRIHGIADTLGIESVGVELEPEWAAMHERTIQGNALALPFPDGYFDAVATSPTWGNRFADHHEPRDPSIRRSYAHDLGRPLHDDNSGLLQWGEEYRDFHRRAWKEVIRVLGSGGTLIVNIGDHIRDGETIRVSGWHATHLCRESLDLLWWVPLETSRLRYGENAEARPGEEWILVFGR